MLTLGKGMSGRPALPSSVAAATWLLYPENYEDRIQCLGEYFVDEV